MRIHLLRILFIAILNAHSVMSYGQILSSNKLVSKIPEPLYILNSTIIGNGLVAHLNPKDFKEVVIYKGQDGPGVLKNLTSAGILAITYDGQINSKSFAEIGLQHGLSGPLSVVLNGHKLDAVQLTTLRIAPEAIGQLRITPATPEILETTMSIQIVESKTNTQKNIPGTVMIR